jgi:hypothetical protein
MRGELPKVGCIHCSGNLRTAISVNASLFHGKTLDSIANLISRVVPQDKANLISPFWYD